MSTHEERVVDNLWKPGDYYSIYDQWTRSHEAKEDKLIRHHCVKSSA